MSNYISMTLSILNWFVNFHWYKSIINFFLMNLFLLLFRTSNSDPRDLFKQSTKWRIHYIFYLNSGTFSYDRFLIRLFSCFSYQSTSFLLRCGIVILANTIISFLGYLTQQEASLPYLNLIITHLLLIITPIIRF